MTLEVRDWLQSSLGDIHPFQSVINVACVDCWVWCYCECEHVINEHPEQCLHPELTQNNHRFSPKHLQQPKACYCFFKNMNSRLKEGVQWRLCYLSYKTFYSIMYKNTKFTLNQLTTCTGGKYLRWLHWSQGTGIYLFCCSIDMDMVWGWKWKNISTF